jgi:HlyD family secretion protein
MPEPSPKPVVATSGDLENALELTHGHKRRRLWLRALWAILALAAVGGGIAYATRKKPDVGPRYETTEVTRGDLHVSITATGTLSALDSVPVGAEISGRVLKVLVDFNDKVTKDQILAEIDQEQYVARRDEANAQLAAANANRLTAAATAAEAELKTSRLRSMADAGLSSTQELEAAEATLTRAQAAVKSAGAQYTSTAASLKVAISNLGKSIIRSPIDGVVLERSIEPGEAVSSGLQTPVLFTLAADLSEMRLAVKVDEADVGQVKAGQKATFTVDAYPNRIFDSMVVSVKNMPTTAQNVVTYETRLSVKNPEGLLRPGMTATATINVDDRMGTLLVPNTALRYTPKPKGAPEAEGTASSKGFSISSLLKPPRGSSKPAGSAKPKAAAKSASSHAVYVLRNSQLERVEVEIGATDGLMTAITAKGLETGVQVVVGEATAPNG